MKLKILLLILSVLLLVYCGSSDDIAGGSTETSTGNAAIVGLIVSSNNQPVYQAKVDLYHSSLVNVYTASKMAATSIRNGTDSTDVNGFFRFDKVDTGSYYISVNYKDSLRGLFQARVNPTDTLVQVNGTLEKVGAISGRIDTSYVGAGQTAYVFIPELQLQVAVSTDGSFVLPSLPPGTFTLRIMIGSQSVVTPTDTVKISVTSNNTTVVNKLGSKTGAVNIGGTIKER